MMQPSDAPYLATFVHLLLIEPLPLYSFYGNYLMITVDLIVFVGQWLSTGSDLNRAGKPTMGDYVDCLNNDAFDAIFSVGLNYTGTCWGNDDGNVSGYMNYGCLALCLIIAGLQALSVLSHGELDFTRGSYLSRKWRLESTRFYQYSASVLLVYTTVSYGILFATIDDALPDDRRERFYLTFAMYQLPPCMGLFLSAYFLTRSYTPSFNYKSKQFKTLHFKRSWSSVFCEGTASFAQSLEHAVLMASVGRSQELEDMLVDPEQLDQVLQVCTFPEGSSEDKDEDSEDKDEDSEECSAGMLGE